MIPTRFGAAMCFLFLFFTVTGAHYSNNLIFLFAFIIVSFLLVAILQTAKNLRGLQVLEAQINAGFPEQSTSASLLVFNKRNLDKFGLRVQFRGQKNAVVVDEIFQNDSQWITHPFTLPKKRGRFFTERVQVSTDAPYGLFYGWYYVYRKDSGVVYPSPKGQQFESKIPRNAGADFSGIKEYVEGDLIHRISWKHSAKRDELLLKEFHDESPTIEIYNIADCPQQDIEEKLSQMSLWICEAEKNHKSYGIILGDKKSTVGSGDTHMRSCLYELGVHEA